MDRQRGIIPPNPLKIIIIGAGNVAWHLAGAIKEPYGRLEAVFSRNRTHAAQVASRSATAAPETDMASLPPDGDIYIIAVPDDAIVSVAEKMPQVRGVVAHTSGTLPIDALKNVICGGYGSFYPLQTFTAGKETDMRRVPFFIEGNNSLARETLSTLARSISDHVHPADSRIRAQIHLAAVFASNFSNALWGVASDILSRSGLSLNVLAPLLHETLDKAIAIGPDAAQTGPAKRGDTQTIQKHLDRLDTPQLKELYSNLTNLIIKRQCQKSTTRLTASAP